MNLDELIYFAGTTTNTHRTDRAGAIAWLTGIYGDDPSAVGTIDGTEDDFGDLISTDLPFVVLGHTDVEDQAIIDRLGDALDGVERWSEALDVVRTILS